MMHYLSLFSGIEAASVAWEPLGWEAMAFAEFEKFPSAVLAERFPEVPNLGDVTAVDWTAWKEANGSPDVMVAGSPCQAFSVAGKRRSLEDARGNLALFTAELVRFLNPSVFVWENVPGVTSTKDNALGCLFGELVGAGEPLAPSGKRWTNAGIVSGPERRIAWRVLDAQYFGVAQRRRRVFVVACPPDGPDPAAILFELEGVRRDSPPSREPREGASTSTQSGAGSGGTTVLMDQGENAIYNPYIEAADVMPSLVARGPHAVMAGYVPEIATCLQTTCNDYSRADGFSMVVSPTLTCPHDGQPIVMAIQGSMVGRSDSAGPQGSGVNDDLCFTLNTTDRHAVSIQDCVRTEKQQNGSGISEGDTAYTLDTTGSQGVGYAGTVRRLTPTECERLQGFPDGWTAIPWRGKSADVCPDGPRYKALGNSMAVPVMRWLGARIDAVLNDKPFTYDIPEAFREEVECR